MGLFKKGLSLYGATWGVPIRPTTKKERNAKATQKLLKEQNALLRQMVTQQAPRYNVTCPHCSTALIAPAGQVRCVKCRRTLTVTPR